MPRHLTGLRIFVASPGDVSEERDSLQGIVNELNRTLGDRTNTTLGLVRWETHAWPGFGLDAQDVINGQIDERDLFAEMRAAPVETKCSVGYSTRHAAASDFAQALHSSATAA